MFSRLANSFLSNVRLRLSFRRRHLSRSGLTRDSSTAVLLSACASYVSARDCPGLCLLVLVPVLVLGCSTPLGLEDTPSSAGFACGGCKILGVLSRPRGVERTVPGGAVPIPEFPNKSSICWRGKTCKCTLQANKSLIFGQT